ncbi:MAG: hypothetical protein F4X82_01160 [Candidatus Spechtbacteria bacterium SB0662_bin_43]|uniref:Uncharacterized protein n=1 Tax=Candidatus Spechtbacteria bacterium SB0662_bin_43 TaxID=2604897 RepID=A0A845DLB7_9BACT|nr:hypothetical protein [Candidatus Spechtbacteria bacterium SB0662_bin_43]
MSQSRSARETRLQHEQQQEGIQGEDVEALNPLSVLGSVKILLAGADTTIQKDLQKFEDFVHRTQETINESPFANNNLVRLIAYKVILVVLHKYLVNRSFIKPYKGFVDSVFRGIYTFTTVSLVSKATPSLVDRRVRESYYDITYNIVRVFLKKEYDHDAVVSIVEDIVREYEAQCSALENGEAHEHDSQHRSTILAQCIVNRLFTEYWETQFDVRVFPG